LLTPPDAPLFPTLDKESQISLKSETETRNSRPTALKLRVSNIQTEPNSRSNVVSKNHTTMPGNGSKRISSSRGPSPATSRSSTPSGRP
ncbi:flocculation protein FLO11-like, partial [Trifolium medium]|nr:flocculation protein FLO11-like [Trifolium medium]